MGLRIKYCTCIIAACSFYISKRWTLLVINPCTIYENSNSDQVTEGSLKVCALLFVHLAYYKFMKTIEAAALLQMTCKSDSLPPKG